MQFTSTGIKFTCICVGTIIICFIKRKNTTYTRGSANGIVITKNSFCFISCTVKQCGNSIFVVMLLFVWILFVYILKYGANLLLFATIYKILIEFDHYSLKPLILKIIKRLLIAITLVLIDKALKNNLQHFVSFMVTFLKVIL